MSRSVKGTFTTNSSAEEAFSEVEGAGKLTRASVIDTFNGDIEGEATLEYLDDLPG